MSQFALLTLHPTGHAARRLLSEASELRLEVETLNPFEQKISWPLDGQRKFTKTLNRISSVEGSEYLSTLMRLPLWGRQYNPWSLREALWDKSRQAIWLSEHQLPSVPFFAGRGPIRADEANWREFAKAHQQESGWVLKMNRGQRGVGVHFIASTNELMEWLETFWRLSDQDFIVQPHWQPLAEYRLTVLGNKVWAILQRSGTGKANFAQGGEASELSLKSAPLEVQRVVEVLITLPADYLSIDLLQGPRGLVINDVNTTPGLEQLEAVTGRNFAQDLWKTLILG
jgi:hypothetical protein